MAITDLDDTDKWNKVCLRLAAMTADGSLVWFDWTHRMSREEAISPLYVADYKSWRFLVFKFSYRHYFDVETYETEEEISIELIDSSGATTWKLPKVPARRILFDRIQFRQANAQSLLEDLLAEED